MHRNKEGKRRQTLAVYLWGTVRPRFRSRGNLWASAVEISCWGAREKIYIPGAPSGYQWQISLSPGEMFLPKNMWFGGIFSSTSSLDLGCWCNWMVYTVPISHIIHILLTLSTLQQLRLGVIGAFPNVHTIAEMHCSLCRASRQW